MRIDSNQSGQSVSENSRPAASLQTASSALNLSANNNNNHNEDQAQLSGSHALVAALAAQASQLPEVRDGVRQENVRQEKVSALRKAVQSGDYQPDPEQVAGALFSHLGSSSPGAVGEADWRASQQWAAAI